MAQYPWSAEVPRFVFIVATLFYAPSMTLAQMEYPPETKAIPIPTVESLPLVDGPFKGTPESLKQFQCPKWYLDAKFGIWAHWGPQAVPGDGDWYAREMYRQNTKRYGFSANQDHVQRYGPPSKFGYKDILPLWKAEKWEPERLMELYKAAGAHYFVAQAVHHDNFDNWDSKYQKWNSVNVGPHKDMVGLWQAAARKQGLPFGVSEHLGHSFTFMQTSHDADKNGPLAGVPYDGANPAFWDLYQLPARPGDTGWYSNDPRWAQEWYARIYDLITRYKPDLLYSDGGLPFGEVGQKIVAQLYNVSIKQHGAEEAVYCSKKNYNKTDFIDGIGVQDLEGRMMADTQPFPWQTDASTGEWFWVPHDHYLSSAEIICGLTDIVSKNGNLLLNITLLPDGSLAPEMVVFLREMADWMKINGEAIFGTRPWSQYGEGPTPFKSDAFRKNVKYTPQDIRFTRKGDDIYAITLGVPTGQVMIHALGSASALVTREPTSITLLGSTEKIQWTRTAENLVISVPATFPCRTAICFKISGLVTSQTR